MLEFQNVSVRYESELLAHINFGLRAGEIAVLLGRNGVGKTTLLRTVTGEVRYEGCILAGGTPLKALTARERARRVSLLPQHLPAPALSVREVVAMGFSPIAARLSPTQWQAVDETLEQLSLSSLAQRPLCTLSGGERQRAFLATVLLQNAPVLLMDEPTTYMDLSFRSRFFSLLSEQKTCGKTILLVLHDLAEAVAVADRILLLEDGTLSFDGTPSQFIREEVAQKHFSVRHYTAERDGKTMHFFAPDAP